MTINRRPLLTVLLVLVTTFAPAQEETGLLRFPAIYGDQVVFTYAGDLFTVAAAGGVARRLTSDAGYEMFARFSPDGKSIAFTGQYDGNTEVFLMPAPGGVPQRLTTTATLGRDDVSDRMGPNNIVMAWKDNNTIVYRSRQREANDFIGQLFVVPRQGGPSRQLPLPRGGFCSFAPDGNRMAYNRVFREFRTWKRYRGGQADDIWIYDFDGKTTTNITNNPAQDIFPMWAGTKIYFVSDRDENKRMNLYAYDLDTQQVRAITHFTDYDVKFPSLGNTAIIFENGGVLHTMALGTERVQKLTITILEDFDSGRGGLREVSKEITNFEIAPDGSRALFGARGDLFTIPEKNGNTRNLTNTSGVHERNSKWSPNGKWIAYIADGSGEDELYIMPQDGPGQPVQLTTGGDTYKYQLSWSPDSRNLLWADKKQRLQYVDVETKQVTVAARAAAWEVSDYTWSPDSRWIAYARPEEKRMTTIQLYSVEQKATIEVTDGWFTSANPAFSADGKYLFFVSARTFTPSYGQTEENHIYADMSNIYLVTLAKDVKSPFGPQSDEVKVKEEKKEGDKKDGLKKDDAKTGKKKKGGVTVQVNADGLQQRIAVLPIPASNYRNLQSADDKLFYIRAGRRDEKPKMFVYNFEKQKETELGEVGGFEISADGKKMIVGAEGAYAILDLPGSRIDMKDRLNLGDMKVVLDRRAEWNQIFAECWRQMRDFFYAPNMHGVDWPPVRKKYETLLKYVNHRTDLTYLIGEMIGELNVGHAYVGGGDYARPDRVLTGLLGAQLERDRATGCFRITKILKGQNWDKTLRSPLTEIGVDVKEGDYILAVEGKPTNKMKDAYEALINTAGKQVTLKVNAKPEETGSRTAVVVPIGDERPLYYYNWVQDNIGRVDKATGGKVGYVHIPDMGAPGLNEFAKYFYPQFAKEGLIVDVRGNGGGSVSPQIIERLRREIAMIDIARNGAINPDPGGMVPGPKVLLLNEFSASDGDIVAYRFKKYKLGPVVGKRSWGGVVGIRGSLPLLDGGTLNRPEFSRYDVEGKEWIMEGHGVDPDIVVDNDPAREFAGIDEQLNKAIELVNEELKKNPAKLQPPPPYPDKSK
jgi:tricorn protease